MPFQSWLWSNLNTECESVSKLLLLGTCHPQLGLKISPNPSGAAQDILITTHVVISHKSVFFIIFDAVLGVPSFTPKNRLSRPKTVVHGLFTLIHVSFTVSVFSFKWLICATSTIHMVTPKITTLFLKLLSEEKFHDFNIWMYKGDLFFRSATCSSANPASPKAPAHKINDWMHQLLHAVTSLWDLGLYFQILLERSTNWQLDVQFLHITLICTVQNYMFQITLWPNHSKIPMTKVRSIFQKKLRLALLSRAFFCLMIRCNTPKVIKAYLAKPIYHDWYHNFHDLACWNLAIMQPTAQWAPRYHIHPIDQDATSAHHRAEDVGIACKVLWYMGQMAQEFFQTFWTCE